MNKISMYSNNKDNYQKKEWSKKAKEEKNWNRIQENYEMKKINKKINN